MTIFPYRHEPELISTCLRARAEGRVHEMSVLDKLAYLYKYCFPPQAAQKDRVEYFSAQQQLRKHLHGPAFPPAATLGFLGDIMWIRKNWGNFLSRELKNHLASLDGLVSNLETVVSKNLPVNEFLPDLFRYNSDPQLVTSFAHQGKSLLAALSFANNHTLDFGDSAALDTLAFLDSQGIPHSGLRKDGKSWVEFARGGIRFGFYAATFGVNDREQLAASKLQLNLIPGLVPEREENVPDLSKMNQVLQEMQAAHVQVKILSLHWGFEFEFYPTARMMQVARSLVAAGADIIVGNHAHIPQPPEVLLVNGYEKNLPKEVVRPEFLVEGEGSSRKALVLYCMGNFASYMYGFYCRLAMVRAFSFFPSATGAIDWWPHSTKFFYNQACQGGRQLVPYTDSSDFLTSLT